MFSRLLSISIFVVVTVQSAIANNLKGQDPLAFTFPKQYSFYDDYYLNDRRYNGEGSGIYAGLDEYFDDDEYDQLLNMINNTTTSTGSSSIGSMTIKHMVTKLPYYGKNNESTTKYNYADVNEFYEDYLEDDIYYQEDVLTKGTSTPLSTISTSTVVPHRSPIRILFSFLTRPPIAIGILVGLGIGIFTSVILLICIVQRFHKRERIHSSCTTGLLYPNQYGYSKSPQEFYA